MNRRARRVLRVYHGGRDPAHRRRDRALAAAGHELTLVVPRSWPERGADERAGAEPFEVVELAVERAGDVNRHRYADDDAVRDLLARRWDLLDLHEEPVSLVARQWLGHAPRELPVVLYTAQNIDKRFPPPFHRYETAALQRARGLYPCSRQAASVARGKGFTGTVRVLPLGYDDDVIECGDQSLDDPEIRLLLAGRLVPEKGVVDAVDVLARVHRDRPARLLLAGSGPALDDALARARHLDVADRVEHQPWLDAEALARVYGQSHVVLVPSRTTPRWVEQFGRVVVEAQAAGAVVAGYASGAIAEVAGGAAELAAEGDVAGLARRVVDTIGDPERFEHHRSAGLRLAAGRTWTAVAEAQSALWRHVVDSPESAAGGRAAARAEFGPTATVGGSGRPFALPVLRSAGPVGRSLGRLLDLGTGAR